MRLHLKKDQEQKKKDRAKVGTTQELPTEANCVTELKKEKISVIIIKLDRSSYPILQLEQKFVNLDDPFYSSLGESGTEDVLVIVQDKHTVTTQSKLKQQPTELVVCLDLVKKFQKIKLRMFQNQFVVNNSFSALADDEDSFDSSEFSTAWVRNNKIPNYPQGADMYFSDSVSLLLNQIHKIWSANKDIDLQKICDQINNEIHQALNDKAIAQTIFQQEMEAVKRMTKAEKAQDRNGEIDLIVGAPNGAEEAWLLGVEVKYYGIYEAGDQQKSEALLQNTMKQIKEQQKYVKFPMAIMTINANRVGDQERLEKLEQACEQNGLEFHNIKSLTQLKEVDFKALSQKTTIINIHIDVCNEIYQRVRNNSEIKNQLQNICADKIPNFNERYTEYSLCQIFEHIYKAREQEIPIKTKQELCGELAEFSSLVVFKYLESLKTPLYPLEVKHQNMNLIRTPTNDNKKGKDQGQGGFAETVSRQGQASSSNRRC